jgi:hypothetical protein
VLLAVVVSVLTRRDRARDGDKTPIERRS